jgi:hypothetical protein
VGEGLAREDADAPCSAAVRGQGEDAWVNAETWSHPVYRASADDPVVDVWEDGAVVARVASPPDATPSVPAWPDGDAHLHLVDPEGATVTELWKARRRQDGGWEADSVAVNDLRGTGVGTEGVRIYGGSAFAGLWREGESLTGAHHALALSLPLAALSRRVVWPATELSTSREEAMLGPVPVGQHVALPQDIDLDALTTPEGRALGRALRDHGAFVVDHARNFALYAEPAAAAEADAMREDVDALRAALRCSTNVTEATPGGPGDRVAGLAPEL